MVHAVEMESYQIGSFQIQEENNLAFSKAFAFDSAVVN